MDPVAAFLSGGTCLLASQLAPRLPDPVPRLHCVLRTHPSTARPAIRIYPVEFRPRELRGDWAVPTCAARVQQNLQTGELPVDRSGSIPIGVRTQGERTSSATRSRPRLEVKAGTDTKPSGRERRPPAPAQEPGGGLDFLSGGGEVGAWMRARDWAATPLGPPDAWRQPLRIALRLFLNTRYPMQLWWGSERLCFHNDAYRLSIGIESDSRSFGRPGRDVPKILEARPARRSKRSYRAAETI